MGEELLKAIQEVIQNGNDEFFGYAWREKLDEMGEFLKEESKYARLVDWIDKEIAQLNSVKNVFCPADRNENTTQSMVCTYLSLIQKLAVLVHCKELLLDKRCTTKMRKSIEYTLCKLYKIKYVEKLNAYI